MKEYIPIVTTIMALIGTFIGLIIGYRKWNKEQHSQKFGQFDKEKQEFYKELWSRVEEFNIKIRIEEVGSNEFTDHLQKLNAFLLKQGIYIDDIDRALTNDYAKAVFDFQKIVKDSNIQEANVSLGGDSRYTRCCHRASKRNRNSPEKSFKVT